MSGLARRDSTTAACRVVLSLLAVALLVGFAPSAAASGARPMVLAVHTGSDSEVSMVLETNGSLPGGNDLSEDDLSVTIGGEPVSTTVTPLASSRLSVVLVIDTSGGMAPDELEAVQSGATEFLLRLPPGAQSAVVASGGSARLVAPLRSGPGPALSAVSALRPDGDRSTAAGVSLAARELSTARTGPRQIVVFTTGADNGDPSVARLSDELVQAGVLTCVVQTQPVDFWTRVVDRAGGSIVASQTGDVVTSFEELAATLEDQYLVAFDAPALPAVATVGVGDTGSANRTLVRIPDPAPGGASAVRDGTVATSGPGAFLVLLLGLLVVALIGLGIVLARRRSPAAVAATVPAPVPTPEPDATLFTTERPRSAMGPPLASLLSDSGSTSARAASGKTQLSGRLATDARPAAPIVLRGHGDGVVTLRKKKDAGPSAVAIAGNAAARFFGVRALGSDSDLLNTLDPYEGVRALDWDGRESTGFEVRATGDWTIQVIPEAAIPTFDTSYEGSGDTVLRFTGVGSRAEITGNADGRYFSVRQLGDGKDAAARMRLVNTTEAYSGTVDIDSESRLFAIEAVGPWTITIR
jgi:hypothetical protein